MEEPEARGYRAGQLRVLGRGRRYAQNTADYPQDADASWRREHPTHPRPAVDNHRGASRPRRRQREGETSGREERRYRQYPARQEHGRHSAEQERGQEQSHEPALHGERHQDWHRISRKMHEAGHVREASTSAANEGRRVLRQRTDNVPDSADDMA